MTNFYKLLLETLQCPPLKITPQIRKELSRFQTDEELLRGGGLSTEALDRAAFGFTDEDVTTIMPEKLKIRWHEDLENVKWEIKQKGWSKMQYAKSVDLSEPIEVEYWADEGYEEGFYIADGHHRYYAALILNKPLNCTLEIKMNPISKLAPDLGYDQFHRCIFKQFQSGQK